MQGVKNSDGTISFNGDGSFTRAQAAKVFVVAKGLSKVKAGTAVFTDVAKDNWAYNWVNVAKQCGIVNGTSDTTFTPSKNVTYGELAKMAVSTLGYTEEDLDGSTYPYNYVQKAADLKLFDNVDNVDPDEAATRADVANVVDAMLNTPTKVEQNKADNSTATPAYQAKSFFTTVAPKFGVKAITGATFVDTALVDSGLKANQFKVVGDSTVYTLADASADVSGNFYKAYNGTFYVSAKDGSTVVMFDNSKITGTVTDAVAIDTAQISNLAQYQSDATKTVNGEVYKYDTTDAKNPVKNNDYTISKDAVVYVNGKKSSKSDLIQGQTVTAKLIDTNNDKVIDAVVATRVSAPHVVVTAPTSDDAKTVGAIDTNYGLTYKDSTGATVAASVYVTGQATKLSEIKANDVIYYSVTDDGAAVKLEVVRSTDKGKVVGTKTNSAGVVTSVTLDNGKSYDLVNAGSAALGNTYTFVLGKDGKAYAANIDNTAAAATVPNVGRVEATKAADGWNNAAVKIQNLDGTFATYEFADSTLAATVATSTYSKQIVTYTLDSGKIKTINVLNPNAVASAINASNLVNAKVYALDTAKGLLSAKNDVDFSKSTGNTYVIVDPNSKFGDYAIVVVSDPTAKANTTNANVVGVVGASVGKAYANDGTTIVDKYTVYKSGSADPVEIKVSTSNFYVPGTPFVSLTTDNGTGVSTVTGVTYSDANLSVVAYDTTRSIINVGTPTVPVLRTLDANVAVFSVVTNSDGTKTIAKKALSDINTTDATKKVTLVYDRSLTDTTATAKVVLIILNY
jgi:hypothetical protein